MKKICCFFLVALLLLTTFSACSSDEASAPDESETPDMDVDVSDGGEDAIGGQDEITEINFWCWDTGTAGQGSKGEAVENAINAITEKEIGVHVNFTWVATSDYGTQITLAIANNEQIDLADYYARGGGAFAKLYAAGSLMDITELAAEYAPETLALCGDKVLSGTTIDGRLYGIPTYRILNSDWYIIMRTDILEDIGMLEFAENMETWEEFEQILQAVEDSDYEGFAFGGGNSGQGVMSNNGCIYSGTNISDSYVFDPLGELYFAVATDQEGNILSQVEMTESQECFKMLRDWYDAGWMYPDSAFSTTTARELIAMDTYFSTFNSSEYGVEANWGSSTGYPITAYKVNAGLLSTSNCQKFGIVVPSTAKEPEAAMRFANLMYTNEEIMNLLSWGIEGENYEVVDGVAQYIDGVDAAGSGYHNNDFHFGNQFLCYPWDPQSADFRNLALANFEKAPGSIYLGLTVDTSEVETLVSTQAAVSAEYHGLMAGGMYTDELYAEYIEKLHAAGLDEWLGIYQTAVDDFLK